jgi:exosortase D (VPLPA-CTERM-specific)
MKELLLAVREINPAHWLRLAVYGGLIAAVYWGALLTLILRDWAKEDYSHCYLIPLVVLYLLWEKRRELASMPSAPSWAGLIPFGLGIGLFWLGELGGEFFTLYMSMWLVIVGLCWLHLGRAKIKTIWFALFMMLTMFPFPSFINVRLSLYLKLISSQLGVWMLQLYGMSAYREGNVIDLGFTQLQVVDACSGLRYLFPLMVLALILAYWFKDRFWKRAVLFLSSIPVAILVNSFRIAMTGVLSGFFGPAVAEGFFHGFSGWLIFLFTLGILVAEMWVLKRIWKIGTEEKNGTDTVAVGVAAKNGTDTHLPAVNRNQSLFSLGNQSLFSRQFLFSILILAVTLGISLGVEFREKIPIKQALSGFPTQVGQWTGTSEPMEQQYIDALQFSDYVIMNYQDRQGRSVNFYTAYYESQRKGESIHSPETCLPGGGWEFREAGAVTIPVAVKQMGTDTYLISAGEKGADTVPVSAKNGTDTNFPAENRSQSLFSLGNQSPFSPMKVNRAFMEKSGSRQLTYYWFAQRGRVLTNLYQLKLYAFWDALTKQRTDGALIRLITPVYEREKLEDAEARLQGFTREIVPVLDGFIPK